MKGVAPGPGDAYICVYSHWVTSEGTAPVSKEGVCSIEKKNGALTIESWVIGGGLCSDLTT